MPKARKRPKSEDARRSLLASAVAGTSELICITDVQDRVQFANRAFLRAYGYAMKEILGQPAAIFDSPNNSPMLRKQVVEETFKDGWRGELLNRKKDGSEFRVFLTISRVLDDDGKTIGLMRVARDTTAQHKALEEVRMFAASLEQRVLERTAEVVMRKDELAHLNKQMSELIDQLIEAKKKAEVASKAKSQFLTHVSHELRTPLNAVIGFTNVLLKNREGTLSRQDVSYAEKILGNAKHLLSVINQLLDLSKIEAGRLQLNLSEFSLESLVIETIAEMQTLIRSDDVTVSSNVPEDLNLLDADDHKLKQVLINLIANALRYTERGSVTVRVIADDQKNPIRIDVSDTGVGIAQDKLESIFEPFERIKTGESREEDAAGLGLTVSRSLCHLMGYDLTVKSEVGKGSTFSIHLKPGSRSG